MLATDHNTLRALHRPAVEPEQDCRGSVSWQAGLSVSRTPGGRTGAWELGCLYAGGGPVALRLERDGSFSGGAGVNQFKRFDVLGIAPVFEEQQSGLGQGAVAFGQRGLLNLLLHRTY